MEANPMKSEFEKKFEEYKEFERKAQLEQDWDEVEFIERQIDAAIEEERDALKKEFDELTAAKLLFMDRNDNPFSAEICDGDRMAFEENPRECVERMRAEIARVEGAD
jgi:hypothetical protein